MENLNPGYDQHATASYCNAIGSLHCCISWASNKALTKHPSLAAGLVSECVCRFGHSGQTKLLLLLPILLLQLLLCRHLLHHLTATVSSVLLLFAP